jgi:hypothetical protein
VESGGELNNYTPVVNSINSSGASSGSSGSSAYGSSSDGSSKSDSSSCSNTDGSSSSSSSSSNIEVQVISGGGDISVENKETTTSVPEVSNNQIIRNESNDENDDSSSSDESDSSDSSDDSSDSNIEEDVKHRGRKNGKTGISSADEQQSVVKRRRL